MAIQPIYNQGTVSVVSGSATVTGSGTAFALALVNGGSLSAKGRSIPIVDVPDDTHLTLAYPAPADMAGNGQAYAIELGNAQIADAIVANRKLADIADALGNKVSAFIRTLLDDTTAAAARATLGAGPTPSTFQGYGGDETRLLGTAIEGRFGVSFIAAGPRVLGSGSCGFASVGSNPVYALFSMRIYDVETGAVMADTTEQSIGLMPDANGDGKPVTRSIASGNLVAGRTYRMDIWMRASVADRCRPYAMIVSGATF